MAAAENATPTSITLYTAQTPNGIKASILLAELGLAYQLRPIKMMENEQKEDWFLAINPNGRIPAMTDVLPDGRPIRVFESGVMLQYLVERYDPEHRLSYPCDTPEHWETTSWLMWQMGGLGPMQGQSNHFKRYASERIEYGINRYGNETRRLYRVLESHLARSASGFLGDRLTIADIATWPWVSFHSWAGVSLDEFPHLRSWLHKLLERPGFEQGRHVPSRHTGFDHDSLTEAEIDKEASTAKQWVQEGMKADAKA